MIASMKHGRELPSTVRVCLIHLGDPRGGIGRYGRAIAEELGRLSGFEIDEVPAEFRAPSRRGSITSVLAAAWRARRADVVVVHYSRFGLWQGRAIRIVQAGLFHLACRRRTVTVLHDVYRLPDHGCLKDSEAMTLAAHLVLSGAVVVHRDEEHQRMRRLPGSGRVRTIPHYVVPAPTRPDGRNLARQTFGVGETDCVVAVLGWIHPRKGHHVAIDALAELPEEVALWFLGGPSPGAEPLVRELEERATRLGVAERLTITGYLSDAELTERMEAVDIGLCPYPDASSSASLASWLGARTPVVASDIPVMREHAVLAPDVIRLFNIDLASGLAPAIGHARMQTISASAFDQILTERSIETIAQRYACLCRELAADGGGRKGLRAPSPYR